MDHLLKWEYYKNFRTHTYKYHIIIYMIYKLFVLYVQLIYSLFINYTIHVNIYTNIMHPFKYIFRICIFHNIRVFINLVHIPKQISS